MDRAEIETGFGPDTFMLLADLSKSLFRVYIDRYRNAFGNLKSSTTKLNDSSYIFSVLVLSYTVYRLLIHEHQRN